MIVSCTNRIPYDVNLNLHENILDSKIPGKYYTKLFYFSDDTDHVALLTSEWAAHVTRLHADSDLGFSQEYDVSIVLSTMMN